MDGEIAVDDPGGGDVGALLARHLEFARANTPPQDVHALNITGLLNPAVTFYSYRRAGCVLGVGALHELTPEHAEVKSMHTAAEARGQGIARAMLTHLISVARDRGYQHLSLETGTMEAFAPARALYASAGFVPCEAFADYRPGPNNTFMTLSLARHPQSRGRAGS